MAVIEHIRGNTYCILTKKICIPFYREGNQAVLLDSGFPDEYKEMKDCLDSEGLLVTAILTSHAHYDHVGNHIAFQKEGAQLYLSEFDAAVTKNFTALGAPFYTENPRDLEKLYGFMVFETDRCFSVRDKEIRIMDRSFRILDIPGHAHSQTGFVTPDGVAYLADALLSEKTFERKTLVFHHNWAEAIRSMEKIRQLSCACYVIAHKGVYGEIADLASRNMEYLQDISQTALDLFDDWISYDEFMLRLLRYFEIHPKVPTKYHILDRECNSILTYLLQEQTLYSRIVGGRMLYKKKPEQDPAALLRFVP